MLCTDPLGARSSCCPGANRDARLYRRKRMTPTSEAWGETWCLSRIPTEDQPDDRAEAYEHALSQGDNRRGLIGPSLVRTPG